MPSSRVSPRRAILCDGSDAIFLKLRRTPCLSTVNRGFDRRTCTRMREQRWLMLANTTASRNARVSSAVSRSSKSAPRKPRCIVNWYFIARRGTRPDRRPQFSPLDREAGRTYPIAGWDHNIIRRRCLSRLRSDGIVPLDTHRLCRAPEAPRTWILGREPDLYAARVGASAASPLRRVLAIESAT